MQTAKAIQISKWSHSFFGSTNLPDRTVRFELPARTVIAASNTLDAIRLRRYHPP
jgi:hypothetical protein